jgi:hypothetical protein
MVTRRSKEISWMFQPVVADKIKPMYAICIVLSGNISMFE